MAIDLLGDKTIALRRLMSRIVRPVTGREPKGARHCDPTENRAIAVNHVLTSAHRGGLVLLHVPTGRLFACNETGARIWQAAANGVALSTVVEEVILEYGVERDVAYQHSLAFLTELEKQGLLVRTAGPRQ